MIATCGAGRGRRWTLTRRRCRAVRGTMVTNHRCRRTRRLRLRRSVAVIADDRARRGASATLVAALVTALDAAAVIANVRTVGARTRPALAGREPRVARRAID